MTATTTAAMAKSDGDEGEAAAQAHEADRHQGEEEPLGVDDAGEQRAVGAGGDQDAHQTAWSTMAWRREPSQRKARPSFAMA